MMDTEHQAEIGRLWDKSARLWAESKHLQDEANGELDAEGEGEEVNTQFPGRPGYTGPDYGWAGYPFYTLKVGYCESFREQLALIDARESKAHQAIRRWYLVRIAGIVPNEVLVETDRLRDESKRIQAESERILAESARILAESDRLYAESKRLLTEHNRLMAPYSAALEAEVDRLVPNAPWDGRQLVFPGA